MGFFHRAQFMSRSVVQSLPQTDHSPVNKAGFLVEIPKGFRFEEKIE